MQLSGEVDRQFLGALGLGDRAVLVEDERLEGRQLSVGLAAVLEPSNDAVRWIRA